VGYSDEKAGHREHKGHERKENGDVGRRRVVTQGSLSSYVSYVLFVATLKRRRPQRKDT
jgi:hypothetical protein